MPAKKTAKKATAPKKAVRASKKQAAEEPLPQTKDTPGVSEYQLPDGTTVIDTVCPKGHSSGKGHVAAGALGTAVCGTCGTVLVAATDTSKAKKTTAKAGKATKGAKTDPKGGVGVTVAEDPD